MRNSITLSLFRHKIDVVVASRPIWHNCSKRRALLEPAGDEFQVRLCPKLQPSARIKEIIHELRHHWTDVVGLPADGESDAIDVSEFCTAVTEQIEAAGGREAFESLQPIELPPAKDVPASASRVMIRSNVPCGCCGRPIAPGEIGNGELQLHPQYGVHIMRRGVSCDACGRVTTWTEQMTPEGLPTSVILQIPPPAILEGEEAREWRAEHPSRSQFMDVV